MENEYFDVDNISFGDIILARRSADDIDSGHEISPHIVIGEEENYIVVLQGSSKSPKEEYERYFYMIEKDSHGFNKDTYFNMNRFRRIHKDKVIRILDRLTKSERKYLKKKVAFNNKSSYHSEDWVNIKTPAIERGDIITDYRITSNDNYYFVLSLGKEFYRCIHLKRYIEDGCVNINGQYYVFDYDDIVDLYDRENYVRFDTLKQDQIAFVIRTNQKHFEHDNLHDIRRGTLVSLDGILYYVYNIEKDMCSAYKVSLDEDLYNTKITVNDIAYYTNFREFNFKVNCTLAFSIGQAREKEIEENKMIKKVSLKQTKKKEERKKHMLSSGIRPGMCVSLKGSEEVLYVVLYRLGNEVCVMDYDRYIEGKKTIKQVGVQNFKNARKIPTNDFCDILEFCKDEVGLRFNKKAFQDVYNSYMNIRVCNKKYIKED
jgi:hypothetical protein